jgi:hypothetical protein
MRAVVPLKATEADAGIRADDAVSGKRTVFPSM